MKYPSKTRRIIEDKILPFDPSMTDLLECFKFFQDKYQAMPTEVVLEERSESSVNRCITCGDCGIAVFVMVFSRLVPNENYETELLLWEKMNAEREAQSIEAARQKKISSDGLNARQAWQSLYRQERISRKHLGRHTIFQS
jgi:hypothetical protein